MNIEHCKAYRLISTQDMKDMGTKGYLLEHNKTKAKVVLMENQDENKVFTIGFRTPPKDSTGVAHIVEHTVLCGSKEFPAFLPALYTAIPRVSQKLRRLNKEWKPLRNWKMRRLTKKRAETGKCELFDNSAPQPWLFPISVVLCVVAKEAAHMRNILEDLYFGKITPNEQDITPGSPLQQAMDQAEEYEEKLSALLEGEEKTMLLRLLNAENEIGSTMALENFILGFRLGMRVAIEALDEDDGSLTALPEGW